MRWAPGVKCLPVLARLLHCRLAVAARDIVVIRVHLGLNEAALKVGMDGAGGLGCGPAVANGPALDLIRPARVEMDQAERVVPAILGRGPVPVRRRRRTPTTI